MTFKIISVGWQCEGWWQQTLRSVEQQSIDDWEICVVYDPGDNEGPEIAKWCSERDSRWHCILNGERRCAVANQVKAVLELAPQPDDIVVFLDLDGDQFAHPDVLGHLMDYYADGTLLTYGNYRPVPYAATCPLAIPFPAEVAARNSYREYVKHGPCSFNHLRTMKGKIINAIPMPYFTWSQGPRMGQYYEAGTDYIFMISGLELAGPRYKCIEEVLLLYNNANPRADYILNANVTPACVVDFLSKSALIPLL